MNYNEVVQELSSRGIRNVKLGLERIKELLQKLDNPHKGLKYIHVAGTNGKGSVCAMLNNILILQGYKTGMFISPALFSFNERFRINHHLISDNELAEVYEIVKPHITDQTFFEIITTMAFVYFKKNNVDFVVFEVGLGGRLDSTNIIEDKDVLVSIITNIGYDHMDYLGNSIKEIAKEKAGIIRRNVPVVTAARGKGLQVIKNVCKDEIGQLFIASPAQHKLNLLGKFQQINAGVVVQAITILKNKGIDISDKNLRKGLETAYWAGRMEFIARNVLIDCAHNLPGIKNLVKEIKRIKIDKRFKEVILIFGSNERPNIRKIVSEIQTIAKTIILSKSNFPKAADPAKLESVFRQETNKKIVIIPEINNAIQYAQSIAKQRELILVAGSCYLVGGIKRECYK